jgi:uncharacterized lipoprotein YajG
MNWKQPLKTLSLLAFGMLFVSLNLGCALSPQSITLRPTLNIAIPALSQSRPLALTVLDERTQKAFGARGGIYATSLITARTEVAQTLRRALTERLQSANFQVLEPSQITGQSAALDVRIQQIDYRVTERIVGGLLNEVRVAALFDATARNNGRLHHGEYQAIGTRQFNGYPNAAQNQALLNEIVGKALQGILSEPELLAVLIN